MTRFTLFLAVVLAVVLAATTFLGGHTFAADPQPARDLVVQSGGKDIAIKYQPLGREITAADRKAGNQASALGCSFLLYDLLARGDIAAAARLSGNPQAASATWTRYRDRLGDAGFRKEMSAYFTSKNVVVAELALEDERMLLVQTPNYLASQFYHKAGDKFTATEMPTTEAAKTLGKAFGLIREGKLKP